MKLRTGILAVILGTGIAGIILIGFFSSWIARTTVEEQIVQDQEKMLHLVAQMRLASRSDYPRLETLASTFNSRLTLIDRKGGVAFDSEWQEEEWESLQAQHEHPEIQAARTAAVGRSIRKDRRDGPEVVFSASRVTGQHLGLMDSGFVRVGQSLAATESTSGHVVMMTATTLMIAILSGTLLVLLLSRRVSSPILDITRTIHQIRNGDVQVKVQKKYDDEIGELAEAVNMMTQKLAADAATLSRLERVRSQFLANVSHELRTPLFSLQGYLETLLDGAVDDPNVSRDFLEKAHRHAERLRTLLTDLIEISSIESGEMKMSFRYFTILGFLEDIIEEMKPVAEQKGLRLSLSSAFDLQARVYGDKDRLRQVMINLIDNAVKYTDPGGSVVLRAAAVRNQCEVQVEDTGCGIPAEHQSRIFERFYRVDTGRSREIGGTGLGLAIVKHIVEAHGGSINLKSIPGKGSTFSFMLKR